MQEIITINGRYVTSELLGGGGMARVFLARDDVLERDVAVKVLRGQYAEDEEFVERFRREALGVASLSHPNIVQVYDRGVSEDGRYYIAMEYVSGGTLKDRIVRDGPLSPDTASAVAVQVADALGAAHERGLIHRDVKPQNVLVTAAGDVKVADFGIARAAAADVISRTSAVLGTARYMSPEQAMGREVGPPSDLYSLGVVLYEMLTGEVPFEADTPVAISMKHVNEPPRPPGEIRGGIPAELEAVVLKLLAKDPGARYASAADLVADLDLVAAGLAPAGNSGREAQTESLRPAPEVGAYPDPTNSPGPGGGRRLGPPRGSEPGRDRGCARGRDRPGARRGRGDRPRRLPLGCRGPRRRGPRRGGGAQTSGPGGPWNGCQEPEERTRGRRAGARTVGSSREEGRRRLQDTTRDQLRTRRPTGLGPGRSTSRPRRTRGLRRFRGPAQPRGFWRFGLRCGCRISLS